MMNLNCFKNNIITNNLAIQIDLTDLESWNLNTEFTSISLSAWDGAVSDNLNLLDFGLTEYDNGMTDRMYSGMTFTPQDTKLILHRIGYNSGQTAFDGTVQYDDFGITGITGSNVGNHFILDGGYVQGFFKLKDYNYEVFPARYNEGITIETVVYITPESFDGGIFYLMGARAEDKYNEFFSGEVKQIVTQDVIKVSSGMVGQTGSVVETVTGWSGVTTSEGNYLISYEEGTDVKKAFGSWEHRDEQTWSNVAPIDNIKDNIMAFFLNPNGKVGLRYIDENGSVIQKLSDRPITTTGWTVITHTFIPDEVFENEDELECAERRTGTFGVYVNGTSIWREKGFNEYYFRGFGNDKEKQIGVPYTISWGGGSFGLKHSWHYDSRTLPLYTGQSQTYVEDNWIVSDNPLNDDPCVTGDTGGTYNSLGLILSADTGTFTQDDACDPNIKIPVPVLRIENTGTTLTQYFIEYDVPIEVLSNRDMVIRTRIYDTGIFYYSDQYNNVVNSQISLVPFGIEDINVIQRRVYQQPISTLSITQLQGLTPFPILVDVYEYVDRDTGLLINGQTGFPVNIALNREIIGDNIEYKQIATGGKDQWIELYTRFNIAENTQQQQIKVGLLIESDIELVDDFLLYTDNFVYYAADKLNQDSTKQDLLIEQNFNSSFIGGIQKLRLYDRGFTAQEVLHNVKAELYNTPDYEYSISTGGRIIYR